VPEADGMIDEQGSLIVIEDPYNGANFNQVVPGANRPAGLASRRK